MEAERSRVALCDELPVIDWSSFAVPLFATIIAALLIVAWVVLIVSGHGAEVPEPFPQLLTGCVIGGILGAAYKQGAAK
jgi:hypothetical protein